MIAELWWFAHAVVCAVVGWSVVRFALVRFARTIEENEQ